MMTFFFVSFLSTRSESKLFWHQLQLCAKILNGTDFKGFATLSKETAYYQGLLWTDKDKIFFVNPEKGSIKSFGLEKTAYDFLFGRGESKRLRPSKR